MSESSSSSLLWLPSSLRPALQIRPLRRRRRRPGWFVVVVVFVFVLDGASSSVAGINYPPR